VTMVTCLFIVQEMKENKIKETEKSNQRKEKENYKG